MDGLKRMLALLARPWAPVTAALVGVVLTLPALGGGLLGDDYLHRSVLLGAGEVGAGTISAFDLFAFVPQGPRREATLALAQLPQFEGSNLGASRGFPQKLALHFQHRPLGIRRRCGSRTPKRSSSIAWAGSGRTTHRIFTSFCGSSANGRATSTL